MKIHNDNGFTLVELVVVIAVLAILAGVAVGAYSGYIAVAGEAADYTMLDSVKTAVIFTVNETHYNVTVTSIEVGDDPANVRVGAVIHGGADTEEELTVDVSGYFGADKIEYKSGATGAVWHAADNAESQTERGWTLVRATR